MKTFAERIIEFNTSLKFKGRLPKGIKVMNPFEDEQALKISSRFFKNFTRQ